MDIIPLPPGFGAELRGVTLADVAAHDAAYRAVRAAFEEYSLLVFRNQNVSDESQLAFSRRFGPPETTKVGSLGTGTHFVILASTEELATLPPQCWRMVWRNPVNGRGALYLASHAYAVEGMDPIEGEKLIDQLTVAATAPSTTYVHAWRPGDVVMWDNRATMH